jgi:nesprin-1
LPDKNYFSFSISSEDDTICAYCNKLDWQAVDNDLWRLEQWLQYAEKTQQTYDFKALTTYSIEQLEDIIQDHREFLLDLDSHKMIVASLTIIGDHLSQHRQKAVVKIPRFHEKLDKNTTKWDAVCKKETAWQIRLHKALLSNDEFYNIIDDLSEWLVESEMRIKQLYPFEVNQEFNFQQPPDIDEVTRHLYEEKLKSLQDIKQELDQCEPRILSLQEAAQQLFISNDANNKNSKLIYERYFCLKAYSRVFLFFTLSFLTLLQIDKIEDWAACFAENL